MFTMTSIDDKSGSRINSRWNGVEIQAQHGTRTVFQKPSKLPVEFVTTFQTYITIYCTNKDTANFTFMGLKKRNSGPIWAKTTTGHTQCVSTLIQVFFFFFRSGSGGAWMGGWTIHMAEIWRVYRLELVE